MSEEANEAIEMQRELEKKIKLRTQKEKQAIQNIKSAIKGMDDNATFDVDLVNGETAKLEHETIKVGDLRLILALQERQYEENGSLKLSSRNLITEMDELEEELLDYKKSYEKLQKENEELRVQGSIILLDYNILKDKIKEIIKEELPDDDICKSCGRYDVNGVVIKQKLIKLLEEE